MVRVSMDTGSSPEALDAQVKFKNRALPVLPFPLVLLTPRIDDEPELTRESP